MVVEDGNSPTRQTLTCDMVQSGGLVTLAKVYIHVADADAVHDMFHRHKDFPRPSKMYSMFQDFLPDFPYVY